MQVVRDDGDWAGGSALIKGVKNATPAGSTIPSGLTQGITQDTPGFVNLAARDVRLTATSPLRGVGVNAPTTISGHAFPTPLARALFLPPPATIQATGTAAARPTAAVIALGAYE
ncbi:Hypothetical protein CAP_7721 [Chondromyces apiculatus DSM 436]|uniref:Uncharacterized protein n=1 Tax=Chondromyces apiculatus DSM 436 TaxID=1192034 RepID=A0A017TFR1_9BACT|nr:Hypothetical protein CAP_7721 [Chondromyces apiculatus DSM 436]